MKKLLILVVANLMLLSFANAAPEDFSLPSDCFEEEDFCYTYGVEYNEELDRKVIRVHFHAQLYIDDYEDVDEVVGLFLDFDSWDDYTASMDDYDKVGDALKYNDVVFVSSVGNGMTHTSHFWTDAPWPISKMEIKERSLYEEIEVDIALKGYKFYLDPQFNNEGIKYKSGVVRIYLDDEEDMYYASATLDVIPEIDFLPTVAAPYVSRGLIAIFKGMFDM